MGAASASEVGGAAATGGSTEVPPQPRPFVFTPRQLWDALPITLAAQVRDALPITLAAQVRGQDGSNTNHVCCACAHMCVCVHARARACG